MKRTQLNLVLAAVVAGLGAAVYFSQEKEEKGPPLTALTADALNKITVEHPDQPALVLEKSSGQWRLTAPVQVAADDVEVGALVNLATLETKSTLDAAGLKLADLGLDPPQYSITLNDQKIELGAVEPLQYRRYMRAGGKIVLTDDPPSAALDADYSDLVDKQLIPAGSEVLSIALPDLSLSKAADGKSWALTPASAAATSDQKQKLVDAWTSARAMWNAMEPPEGSKGDEVTVILKDRVLKFIVTARDPQIILARPDLKVRYTLSKALEAELFKFAEAPQEETKDESSKPAPESTAQ